MPHRARRCSLSLMAARALTPRGEPCAVSFPGPLAWQAGSWLSCSLAVASFFSYCRLRSSCCCLSCFFSHTWQWMITQVSLDVAYGGSLEIHPQSFKLVISIYVEGEETKKSGSDECRVNMLAFFRGGAKASQAAHSVSLVTLPSPQVGAGFLHLSTITPSWLVKWGTLTLGVSLSFSTFLSCLDHILSMVSFLSSSFHSL